METGMKKIYFVVALALLASHAAVADVATNHNRALGKTAEAAMAELAAVMEKNCKLAPGTPVPDSLEYTLLDENANQDTLPEGRFTVEADMKCDYHK